MCSNDKCVTCIENHIVYAGTCVDCLSIETCPYNNSDEIYCVDEHDLSHCGAGAENCSDHACISGNCGNGVIDEGEECEIGGNGCQGCVCTKGWYSTHSKDCETRCWDGNLTLDEEYSAVISTFQNTTQT